MTDKLEALKAAALAATPGPWYVHDKPDIEGGNYGIDTSDKEFLAEAVVWWGGPRSSIWKEEDAVFIAQANPAAVLELLAALEEKDQREKNSNATVDVLALRLTAQDDHINQQQDRIDTLEKKNADLGKYAGELAQRLQQPALADVIAERQRQISAEGWTPNHDDQHTSSEMAGAAACYARHVNARGWVYSHNPDDYQCEPESCNWPWEASWWKPTNPRRDLVKAGALILAEIERLDRAAAKVEGE